MGWKDSWQGFKSGVAKASKKNVGSSGYSETYFPTLQRKPVAASSQDTAARAETKAAKAEQGAAGAQQRAADEERRSAQAQENFLKKLLNKNVTSESTDTSAAPWISVALIILGLAEYLLRISTAGLSSFAFGLSLLLFLLSGIVIAHYAQKDKITILIPMLLFVVWYFFYNGNYNPGFLLYFIPIALGILAIPMFLSKGESIAPELLGFVPVLFFFLDIGLIPFLVENLKLPVTPLLQNLILFMPWWMMLGVFTFPGSSSKSTSLNALLNFLRIIGIIYILFIIIAPAIPGLGYEKSLLPEAGEFESAQQRLRAAVPQRENPALSNLACIFSDPTNVQSCVEQRPENSELTYICEKVEGKAEGTPQFTQCMQEQREKRKDAALQVQGVIDPTIKEPTKAEILIDKESFPTEFRPTFAFPFELKIENPREQQITASLSCRFEGKSGSATVEGRVQGVNPTTFNDNSFQNSYLCFATEGATLDGNYEVIFEATLQNLKTESLLQRAFVGSFPAEEIEELRTQEINKVIKIVESRAPADFAHINFNIGHGAKQAVIENNPQKSIQVYGNIENAGSGRIVAVKSYQIAMDGFTVNDPACLQGTITITDAHTKNIPLGTSCQITDYPEELKNPPQKWKPKTFIATLIYDYQINKKERITIKPAVG